MDQNVADELINSIMKIHLEGWKQCAKWSRRGMLSIIKFVKAQPGDSISKVNILLLLQTYLNALKVIPPLPNTKQNMGDANKSNLTYEDWIKKIRDIGTEDGDK